jgi:hypothetical protein
MGHVSGAARSRARCAGCSPSALPHLPLGSPACAQASRCVPADPHLGPHIPVRAAPLMASALRGSRELNPLRPAPLYSALRRPIWRGGAPSGLRPAASRSAHVLGLGDSRVRLFTGNAALCPVSFISLVLCLDLEAQRLHLRSKPCEPRSWFSQRQPLGLRVQLDESSHRLPSVVRAPEWSSRPGHRSRLPRDGPRSPPPIALFRSPRKGRPARAGTR